MTGREHYATDQPLLVEAQNKIPVVHVHWRYCVRVFMTFYRLILLIDIFICLVVTAVCLFFIKVLDYIMMLSAFCLRLSSFLFASLRKESSRRGEERREGDGRNEKWDCRKKIAPKCNTLWPYNGCPTCQRCHTFFLESSLRDDAKS